MTLEIMQAVAFGIRVIGPLALVTIGFALIYRVSRQLHFAYGGLWVLSSYIVGSSLETGRDVYTGFLLATLVTAPLAVGCYFLYTKLTGQFTVVLASFGLFTIIVAGVQLGWGPQPVGFSQENPLSTVWSLTIAGGSVALTQVSVVALIAALVLGATFGGLLGSSAVGLRLQALSQDVALSRTIGVDTTRMNVLCYVVGTLIANVSASLHVLGYGASLDSGTGVILGALTVAILGGSVIVATILAAILFGLLQVLANSVAGPETINLIGYSVLLLVLRYRPDGLFPRDMVFRIPFADRGRGGKGQHE